MLALSIRVLPVKTSAKQTRKCCLFLKVKYNKRLGKFMDCHVVFHRIATTTRVKKGFGWLAPVHKLFANYYSSIAKYRN